MRAKYFSTTALTIAVLIAGVAGALNLYSNADVVYAQDAETTENTETQNEETAEEQLEEVTIPEQYSYTVQPGDGVTHLILDLARNVGLEFTPSQAYDVARSSGSAFLEGNLTVESDAPYTNGIGGFPEPGVVIAASQHPTIFNSLGSGSNAIARGETPTPAEGTDELEPSDSEDANQQDSEDENADEATDANGNGLSPLAIVLGIVGIAAIAYYVFGRSQQE